jgi:GNAT superfamily N-acetyltransferase
LPHSSRNNTIYNPDDTYWLSDPGTVARMKRGPRDIRGMQIRQARLEDAKKCFRIFLKDNEEYWTEEDFRSSAADDRVIFLIAEEQDSVVGYVLGFFVPTRKSEVGLHETRVDRDRRGTGIGSALVNAFVQFAFEKGAKVVSADVEKELLPFYHDACGFKRAGEWIEVSMKSEFL